MSVETEPCGSWRTTRLVEGHPIEEVWCSRTEGPCPYLGTIPGDQHDVDQRRCGAEPGTILRVSWAPNAIDEALTAWRHYVKGSCDPPLRASQDAAVMLDALRTCAGADE